MATYRDLLAQVKTEIDELGAAEARERQGSAVFVDVREREEWEEGAVPGAVHIPRGQLESRIEGLVPDRGTELVLYCAGGTRSAFAAKSLGELGYENVTSLIGGFTDWKRNGYPIETPSSLTPDQRRRYSRHLLIPEVGEAGQEQAARLARAADRRRRARLACGALPRRRRRRHARHRRCRRRRRLEPAAPDRPLDRQARRGRRSLSAKRTIEALNPDVKVEGVRGAAHVREHRADPRRRLGCGRRRRRQLPDPLPRQRRLGLARHPRRARLDLPLRGPGDRLQAAARARATAASSPAAAAGARSELRRGRRARRAARDRRLAPGERDDQADARHRRDARRPAAPASTRSRTTFDEVAVKRDPACPVCGEHPTITEYIDYVEFCAGVHA